MEVEEIARKMRERVSGSGFKGSVKFDCGGAGVVVVDGETVTTADTAADCTIGLARDDLEAMIAGDLDPTAAFMQGRIRVDGDLSLAIRLNEVL